MLAAYRATVHDSTGFTPNRLFLGRETRMPIDALLDLPPEQAKTDVTVHYYLDKLQNDSTEAYRLAREKLHASAKRRKHHYDLKVRAERFKMGDFVYYHYPHHLGSKSAKWQTAYTGPFLTIRLIEPSNCVLQKTPKSKPFVVHFDKLKKCFGATPASWVSVDTQ